MIVIKEENEKTLMYAPTEKEEHTVGFLTQWEMDLEMVEDWLKNPYLEKDCQDVVMKK
jgi:hypothetical protein